MTAASDDDPSGEGSSEGSSEESSRGDSWSHTIDRDIERAAVRTRLFGSLAARVGRYAVGRRLGAGASSVVYAGWDHRLARWVALKIFVARSAATRAQMLREARALAQLSHPNIVPVFDVGEWNDHAFIAMELIEGTTLARWQAAPERTVAELLAAYAQAGRGLAAAHRGGLVHRDFKPANVMVASGGRVVVSDFGLVGMAAGGAAELHRGEPGSRRGAVGTPAYVAPEQRTGAAPDPAADVYSFSLALCEALLGRHPMDAPPRIWQRELARKVARPIRAAIGAGLAEDPAHRRAALDRLIALLEAPRSRRRRTVARWFAATAVAVVGFAVARCAARTEPVLPPSGGFHAEPHAALVQQVDEWIAKPPRPDDVQALAKIRTLLLHPLPREIPCRWPAPIISAVIGAQDVAGLDARGRVYACALADGSVSLAVDAARCVALGESGTLGVIDAADRPRVVRRVDRGWQPMRVVGPLPVITMPVGIRACPIEWRAAGEGAVHVEQASPGRTARASGAIQALLDGTELRIRDRGGAQIARRSLDASMRARDISKVVDIARDDAGVLAVSTHGPLAWFDVAARRWRTEPLSFDVPSVERARLSPSGRRVLLVDYLGRTEVRTLGGGQMHWLTGGAVVDAMFEDDDTVVALDSDARVWRWDLARLRSGIAALHDGWVWSTAHDDAISASGSEAGAALVVDRRDGEVRFRSPAIPEIYKVLLDGDRLVAAGIDGLHAWRWRDGAALPLADGDGLRVWDVAPAVAGDGSRIYVAGALRESAIYLWSARQRVLVYRAAVGRVNRVAVAPDGRRAAVVTSTGALVIVDVVAQRVVAEIDAHPLAQVRGVAYDAATAGIITIGDDGYARAWSASSGSARWKLAISADALYGLDVQAGRAAVVARDGSVVLIDVASGALLRRFRRHQTAALAVRLRRDGQWLVSGEESGRACLWRSDTSECHTWLDGHTKGVLSASFADDGTIFTSGKDGAVRFWRPTYDAPPDQLLAELATHGSVTASGPCCADPR